MPTLNGLIAVLVIVLLSFCAGFYVENQIKNNEIHEQQIANDTAVLKATQAAQAQEQLWQSKFNQQDEVHNAKVQSINSEYNAIVKRLQSEAANSNRLPVAAHGNKAGSCPATGNGIPWKNKQAIIDLAKIADDQANDLIKCRGKLKAIARIK